MNKGLKAFAGVAAIFALASCSTPVGQKMSADFNALTDELGSVSLFSDGYVGDGDDVCFAERRSLAEEGSPFDSKVVQSTLLGAASGGLIALVTGQSVAKGVVIGAGLGLAAGYLSKLQEEGLNGNQITQRVRGEVREDNRRIDRLLVAFDRLSDCRKREAATVQAAFNDGSIDRATAEERMAEVRGRFAEDRQKFREIADAISEKSRNNAALYNDIAADNGGRALEVQEYRRGRSGGVVRRKTAQKEAGTEEGSLVANKSEVNGLQSDCLTNVKKRDDCYKKVEEAEDLEEDIELDIT